jgi:Heterokaryon incompatibility protein (HET)
MRLLDVETMALRSFEGDVVPENAILSHTWRDDEALLEDLRGISRASKKAGFAKIKMYCDQAREDGLGYFWVDTFCIKKSNPAELQQSINSMFHLYRNAERCYVYLSDISTTKRKVSDRLAE